MNKDLVFLAFRNLKRRGLRSWLTMLGIFIGIAAVVSLISLGQGLQEAVTGQFSSLSADRLVVSSAETGFGPPGAFAVRKLTERDERLVSGVSGVRVTVPRLLRITNIEYNDVAQFSYLGSIPKEQDQVDAVYETFNMDVLEGRLLEKDDYGKVVLGNDFTDINKFDRELKVGSRISLAGEDFEVIGILDKASTFTINSVILITERDMKDILNIGDEIDILAVIIDDPNEAGLVADRITEKLRRDRGQEEGEEDFSVETPQQAVSSINTILGAINIVIVGIALISLFIGGVGIANTMFTSVLERTKEIGVMKAIGARNYDIMTIFLTESALLGLTGGIIGALIGLGIAFGVSSVAGLALGGLDLKVTLSVPLLLSAIGFSLVIGVISGIVPALQASRMSPVEALRQ